MTSDDAWVQALNLHAVLHSDSSAEAIASMYRNAGWSTRKSGFDEYELRTEFAELILEGRRPVLLHGVMVRPATNVEDVLAVLRLNGVEFSGELYGNDHALITEFRSGPA